MNRRSPLPARLMLLLATLTAGILGAGLLAAGFGGPGIARGTSEAIGYPTSTPIPPPPSPPATATSVPVPPTATMAPPTATVAPASATPIPPPASPTTAPGTAIPSSTATVTKRSNATPTPSVALGPAPLSLHLSASVVATGDTLVLQVQTVPGLALKAVVRYPALNRQVVITGTADHHGLGQLTVPVTVSPLKGKASLAALITLTAGDRAHQATETAAFTVYPSLHFDVFTMLVTRADAHGMLILVSLARPAAVDIRLVFSGKQQPIVVHAPASPGGDVLLQVPMPARLGAAKANLQVTVLTGEGVKETHELTVPVGS